MNKNIIIVIYILSVITFSFNFNANGFNNPSVNKDTLVFQLSHYHPSLKNDSIVLSNKCSDEFPLFSKLSIYRKGKAIFQYNGGQKLKR